MQLDLTELSSYLPSVSCFEFGNAFSILFPCTEGRVRTIMTSAGTPRAGAFRRRFNDDYSPPGSFGARGSVEDRARPFPGAA